ncbi:MAG: efflux RND transporter permease subunit [Saprospiraceae bacterium]|jgi:multidrug efflux pump subunit AcrB|nr:efflux RND transporter permease subunit [Saprospiraceae bacterium]
MKIAEFSVKNYQFTLVVFLGVLALGIFSLFSMPKGEDPEPVFPGFLVVAVYPGATPADMEEQVVDPMEKKFNELENVKDIITDISDGLAVIRIEYEYGVDTDEKYQEVIREVNALQKDLPQDIYRIDVEKLSPNNVNIFQVALISETASYKQLKEEAEELSTELEKIKSLKNVEIYGFPEQQVRIALNAEKMAQQRIPGNAVMGALQSENLTIPGGSLNLNTRKFNVKTSGNYKSVDEIANTIVYAANGQVIYLKDIADVRMDYEQEKHLTRINGHRALFVTAAQKKGQNIFGVRDQVLPVLEKFEQQIPSNIDYYKVFDQSASVEKRLGRFAKDFAIAILLVLITLLPLGIRASLVVMISIPLSIAIGLTMLNAFGYTLNQLSIVGLIVALGILVDDSIVVVENIERHLRMGLSRREAAIAATRQIGKAVLGCTATLVLAFLPLIYLPESSGDFIRSLPMAVVTTILASLLVSITIVPFLSSRLLSDKEHAEGNLVYRAFKKGISMSYSKLLTVSLRHPWITLAVAGAIFAGSVMLAPVVGFSLFPASERPMFMVNVETPEGSNLYETDRVTRHVEAVLGRQTEVKSYAANVGQGHPQVYYNVFPNKGAENIGQIFVQLYEMEPDEKEAFIDELRDSFSLFPNAKIVVQNFEQGPPIEAPIAIRIFGENLDTLRTVAGDIENLIATTPGAIYVTNPLKTQKTDLAVRINKEKAAALGVPVAEIDRTVRMGIAGLDLGVFRNDQGEEYTMLLTLPKQSATPDLGVFDQLYVNNLAGTAIPVRQVADVEFETSANTIRHYNKERYVTITALVQSGYLTGDINAELQQKLKDFKFPEGFNYVVAGEVESQQESFSGIGLIILITVFGLIGVLILEFKTFKSTLIVLSVIPLGIIGAILILLLTGNTLSFTAVVGLIALAGIEVKNSILLVDFTNQLREQGKGLDEAIQEAGEIRFVPIVLTSLTAIGGLIPLVLEYSPLYSPLALVLIGGLISSTLLSRLVTPVLYKLLPPSLEGERV